MSDNYLSLIEKRNRELAKYLKTHSPKTRKMVHECLDASDYGVGIAHSLEGALKRDIDKNSFEMILEQAHKASQEIPDEPPAGTGSMTHARSVAMGNIVEMFDEGIRQGAIRPEDEKAAAEHIGRMYIALASAGHHPMSVRDHLIKDGGRIPEPIKRNFVASMRFLSKVAETGHDPAYSAKELEDASFDEKTLQALEPHLRRYDLRSEPPEKPLVLINRPEYILKALKKGVESGLVNHSNIAGYADHILSASEVAKNHQPKIISETVFQALSNLDKPNARKYLEHVLPDIKEIAKQGRNPAYYSYLMYAGLRSGKLRTKSIFDEYGRTIRDIAKRAPNMSPAALAILGKSMGDGKLDMDKFRNLTGIVGDAPAETLHEVLAAGIQAHLEGEVPAEHIFGYQRAILKRGHHPTKKLLMNFHKLRKK